MHVCGCAGMQEEREGGRKAGREEEREGGREGGGAGGGWGTEVWVEIMNKQSSKRKTLQQDALPEVKPLSASLSLKFKPHKLKSHCRARNTRKLLSH